MGISVDTIIERVYFDEVTQKMVKVDIKILDALYLDFLKRIAGALS